MDSTGEMLLLGAGLVVAGAIIAVLFWPPRFEEGDPHYGELGADLGLRRNTIVIVGIVVAAIGLAITLWQLYRLVAHAVP